MAYEYDLFISYASSDRRWSERLYTDLMQRYPGLRCFWDREALQLGAKWQEQLEKALITSQHFAVLWSDAAIGAGWVGPEIEKFTANAASAPGADLPPDRKLFYIPLQGARQNLENRQGLADLRQLQAYGKEFGDFTAEMKLAWDRIVRRIGDDIEAGDASEPVLLAIVAATRPQLDHIIGTLPTVGLSLNELLKELGRPTLTALQARYDTTALQWQPFGPPRTVLDILNDVRDEINSRPNAKRIRWELVDLMGVDLTDAPRALGTLRQMAVRLRAQLSLIVIDPIALYHAGPQYIFRQLGPCFDSDQTLVLTLSPQGQDSRDYLNEMLRALGAPLLEKYYEPSLPLPNETNEKFPICGINIAHKDDIKRLILLGLSHRNRLLRPAGDNPYTSPKG